VAKWVVLMVALCQPVGASFLPDFCYKVHGFDERLKVVSKIPTFQRKLLGYSPTRAEVNLSPAGRTSFAWLAQNLGVAWPLTAGPHVAGLVSRGCFLRPKRPASGMGGRRAPPGALHHTAAGRRRRALLQNLSYALDTTCILRGDNPCASS
jgi:hypothetical protein